MLESVLHGIAKDDETKQTPCREFDVAKLTDHLMNSITAIGGRAGAEFPERDRNDSVERQVIACRAAGAGRMAQTRPGRHRAVRGNEAPATMMAGILSIEFLVHAWDYAKATGREVTAPDALSDYVMGLAKTIITPQGRTSVGFDDPVDVAADAGALDRLVAYTGREPS